jgi:hypothetical protein
MRALLGNGNWRTRLPPVHPGAVLRHDFFESPQSLLAKAL